jgi:hypothetical protein
MPNNGYYLLRLREIEKKSAKVLSFKSELEEIDDFTQRLRINLANNE